MVIFIVREIVQPCICSTESIKPSLNVVRLLLPVMPSKYASLIPQISEVAVIQGVSESISEVVVNGIPSHFFLRT
jgi:hypothetical protein